MKHRRQESKGRQVGARHGGVGAKRARRAVRLAGQLGAIGLLLAGCKVGDDGFGGAAGDPNAPIMPASVAPAATDAGTPAVVIPSRPPVAPAPDGGASTGGNAPGTAIPPTTAPPPPPAMDAAPAPVPPPVVHPDTPDASPLPPSASKPDTCAPAGTMLQAQVRSRVRGADDFTFDNDGNLLLFQNGDVLRLDADMQPFVVLRNVIGLGNGALHALPGGDLLIAETNRDQILRVDPTVGPIGQRPMTTTMQLKSPMKIVPALTPGSVYITSQSNVIYLLDTLSGQMKTAGQLDYRPAGIAIDAANHKVYVGDTGRSTINAYDIGATGDLSAPTTVVTQIAQPTALLVDACGGLYMGGADTGNVHRRAPGPGITAGAALTTVARVEGPDVATLAFGSGKHGWSDQSLFLLDTWDGILSEVPLKK